MDRAAIQTAIDAAARARHEQYVASGGTWVTWELLSEYDRDEYRWEVRWIEVACDGGCGRRVGAHRASVEAGARVLCTSCAPGDLPLFLADGATDRRAESGGR